MSPGNDKVRLSTEVGNDQMTGLEITQSDDLDADTAEHVRFSEVMVLKFLATLYLLYDSKF